MAWWPGRSTAILRTRLLVAAVLVVIFVLAGFAILRDRAVTLATAEAVTHSFARLLTVHAESALEDANKILVAIYEPVRAWDFADPVAGRRLFTRLQELLLGSPQISSAWVMDAAGISRLDSWTWPPQRVDGSQRAYFQAHLADAADPVVLDDQRPGAVTGRKRFTFSRAQRDPDGSLRAVLVVGIYHDYFAELYTEAMERPGARTGLYALPGGVLGRSPEDQEPSSDYVQEVNAAVRASSGGSAIIVDRGRPYIVSWQRSAKYPDMYGSSAQPLDLALAEWRRRSVETALVAGLAGLAIAGLAVLAARAAAARQRAELRAMLVREVDHRVRNSLQIVASLLRLRTRDTRDPEASSALRDAADQVAAVADVHRLIETSDGMEKVEIGEMLRRLCEHVGRGLPCEVAFAGEAAVVADASRATRVAVIVNELATNAVKHARTRVEVRCGRDGDALRVMVTDDGPGVADGFALEKEGRFGLPIAASLARSLGGSLSHVRQASGAAWELRLPLGELVHDRIGPMAA